MNFTPSEFSSFPGLDMVFIEGGTFDMGDARGDLWEACRPVHRVKLDDFYMSKYQVTQGLWQDLMGGNPARFKGEKRPVEQVSWEDTQEFLKKLNERTQMEFRLPTEAEWEYAARGGALSEAYLYAGSDKLRQVGWYEANSSGQTQEVGQLRPNELGLYDMSGNVWEWCADWFSKEFFEKCHQQGLVENPVNLEKGAYRVVRGGGFFYESLDCRPTLRNRDSPGLRGDHIGFRLVGFLQSDG